MRFFGVGGGVGGDELQAVVDEAPLRVEVVLGAHGELFFFEVGEGFLLGGHWGGAGWLAGCGVVWWSFCSGEDELACLYIYCGGARGRIGVGIGIGGGICKYLFFFFGGKNCFYHCPI